jgi:hypothetical protein
MAAGASSFGRSGLLTDPASQSPFGGTPDAAVSASLFLVLLLVGDLVYVAVHLVWTETRLLDSPLAALDVDRGYAEFFQYIKLLWTVLLLACLGLRTRQRGYLAWALLFAYLLVDDSFTLHEELGELLAERLALNDALGLRAIDFGELLVSAAAGVVLAAAIGWAYRRGSAVFQRASRHLLVLLLAVVFFGVVVDMVHIALDPGETLDKALVILEDGGELVAMSFITWYAFLLLTTGHRSSGPSLAASIGAVAANARAALRQRR